VGPGHAAERVANVRDSVGHAHDAGEHAEDRRRLAQRSSLTVGPPPKEFNIAVRDFLQDDDR
jgi:hypothetical protein